MQVPMERILLILDKFGNTIKQDAFFYPVCRKYSSFPELCNEIKQEQTQINRDVILLWFGHRQIFRFGMASVTIELKKLLSAI